MKRKQCRQPKDMLLVTQEAPYFIDRKFDFYMIQGFEYALLSFFLLYFLFTLLSFCFAPFCFTFFLLVLSFPFTYTVQ